MPINNAVKAALRALSYPEMDLSKTYKLERAVKNLAGGRYARYDTQDIALSLDGREVLTRVYTPEELKRERLLLFFHGGGWVTENIDTYNKVCMNLADKTGCRVASVEYSLAPEKPFPHAVLDCYAVTKEVIKKDDYFDEYNGVTLIGDSAGGNLAAAVSLLARDRGEFKVEEQILLYPATYNDHTDSSKFASVHELGGDYLLTSHRISEYMKLYIQDEQSWNSPYFAPLLAEDFSNLPDTLVITAEYDPLRDEGEAYAEALRQAGNYVMSYRMEDALHGFFSLDANFQHPKLAFLIINTFLNRS